MKHKVIEAHKHLRSIEVPYNIPEKLRVNLIDQLDVLDDLLSDLVRVAQRHEIDLNHLQAEVDYLSDELETLPDIFDINRDNYRKLDSLSRDIFTLDDELTFDEVLYSMGEFHEDYESLYLKLKHRRDLFISRQLRLKM